MHTRFLRFFALAAACVAALPFVQAKPGAPIVYYTPLLKIMQGNQPLNSTYSLTVTAPYNLTTPATVTLVPTVLAAPAGVSNALALSFLTISPATLTFTGSSQMLSYTLTLAVPSGNYAGTYGYQLVATSSDPGWVAYGPNNPGATINATVNPTSTVDLSPPSVVINSPADGVTYTYNPVSGGPLSVPVSLTAGVGTGGSPITALTATVNGTPITGLIVSGLSSLNATATATLQLSASGTYTLAATANNANGHSNASATFNVIVSAPPPTITPAQPVAGSTYSYTLGGPAVSVPVSFTANSAYGAISGVTATLNGAPVSLSTTGSGSTNVTAAASLGITAPGSYTLVYTATSAYGTATQSVAFTVTGVTPPPTVSILTPASNAVFTRTAGSPATTVSFTFQGAAVYGTVQSVTITLDGSPIAATVTGLNTASITGSGSYAFTGTATHTLSVALSNGGANASASTTFQIQENQPQPSANLIWLPPISLNKTQQGGSTIPIKFTLQDGNGQFVRDPTDVMAIYEVFPNGTSSTPVIYPYGTKNKSSNYVINGNHYQLNFPTAQGVHHYVIEVYHPLDTSGNNLQLLGSHDLFTSGQSCSNGGGDDDHQWGDGDDHDGDRGGNCNSGDNGWQDGQQGNGQDGSGWQGSGQGNDGGQGGQGGSNCGSGH